MAQAQHRDSDNARSNAGAWDEQAAAGKPVIAVCASCGAPCKPPETGAVAFCEDCLSASHLDDLSEIYVTLGGGD